jgi:predicted enzyme related to lactoylglutathione lyase
MSISLTTTHLTVHDVDLALAFYRDTLGLTVTNDVKNDYGRWTSLQTPDQSDITIVLSEPHAGRSPEDGDALARLLAKGALNGFIFAVDDLDATFEKVQASGAEVLQEPMDQPWGVRDAAFRDPSGNTVRLNQA